jgi:hypothetical protein
MKKHRLFSIVLPIVALVVSGSLILFPTLRTYKHLKELARGSAFISLGGGKYQITIPADGLLRFVIFETAFEEQGKITILNAPGHFPNLLVSLLMRGSSNWSPAALTPSLWRVLTFPLFALPAWFFVGRGFDSLFSGGRIYRGEMVTSLLLVAVFLTLSLGLRFGLAVSECEGQGMVNWYITGFALWAALIAIPSVAWFRQRKSAKQEQQM